MVCQHALPPSQTANTAGPFGYHRVRGAPRSPLTLATPRPGHIHIPAPTTSQLTGACGAALQDSSGTAIAPSLFMVLPARLIHHTTLSGSKKETGSLVSQFYSRRPMPCGELRRTMAMTCPAGATSARQADDVVASAATPWRHQIHPPYVDFSRRRARLTLKLPYGPLPEPCRGAPV